MGGFPGTYFDTLHRLLGGTETTDAAGAPIPLPEAFARVSARLDEVVRRWSKVMIVGNGGSAGIASHMAIDYTKNGGIPALAFSDPAALTCLGNDLGYENVFAKQIEMHARDGDVLFAISSSGQSPNILNAVAAACKKGCTVISFSGFASDNPLRRSGDVNFYVSSSHYGYVEISHLTLIHAVLDMRAEARAERMVPAD